MAFHMFDGRIIMELEGLIWRVWNSTVIEDMKFWSVLEDTQVGSGTVSQASFT